MSRTNHQAAYGMSRKSLKTKFVTTALCALLLAATAPRCSAVSDGPMATAVDVTVARPISFTFMVVGSVLFVVSLPIALTSHSVKNTAHTLVVAPATDTFSRPLGDLDDFMSFY